MRERTVLVVALVAAEGAIGGSLTHAAPRVPMRVGMLDLRDGHHDPPSFLHDIRGQAFAMSTHETFLVQFRRDARKEAGDGLEAHGQRGPTESMRQVYPLALPPPRRLAAVAHGR